MEMRIVILAICVAFAAAKTSKFNFHNSSFHHYDYCGKLPGDPKKLHELDRLYLLDSKRYEVKQGVSI